MTGLWVLAVPQYESLPNVNIRSGNGFLPDGAKPLPEPTLIRYCWHLYQCKLTVIYMWLAYLISAISFAPIWRNKIRCTFTRHTKIYLFCNWDVMVYANMWRDWIIKMITHYGDVIMGTITSQITSLTIVYSTVYSDADQRKHQSSASLAFVRGIHRGQVNSRTNGQ